MLIKHHSHYLYSVCILSEALTDLRHVVRTARYVKSPACMLHQLTSWLGAGGCIGMVSNLDPVTQFCRL